MAADTAQITHLQDRVHRQLALQIHQVLNRVGCAPVGRIGEGVRLRNIGDAACDGNERVVPIQVRRHRIGVEPQPACQVPRHIELWIARILRIEIAGAGPHHPLGRRRPGDAQPRSEVVLVGEDQAVAEPAVLTDFNIRPAEVGDPGIGIVAGRARASTTGATHPSSLSTAAPASSILLVSAEQP